MADVDSVGFLTAFDSQPLVRNDISAVAVNFFTNRTPLVSRTPRVAVGSTHFTIVTRNFRPAATTLASAMLATDTTITVADSSSFMVGDVIELLNTAGTAFEHAQVVADPIAGSTNTLSIVRAVSGTTAVANTSVSNTTVRLIGNARTGSEINQSATNFLPVAFDQYCQTWQHPVQVGGSLQASSSFVPPPDASTPLDSAKMLALQNLMDDMERSSYYGRVEAPSSGTSRPKQAGLRQQIRTNITTAPTNAGAYKPTDFIRDTVQRCFTNGGNPDVILMSGEFQQGLATWGSPAQRIEAGTNVFGMPIDVFEAPFLQGMYLIFAYHLRPYTAVCLTSQEVRMRMKRNEFWQPRGIAGDAVQGDFIAEGASELQNEQHHAWVENITAFSAT